MTYNLFDTSLIRTYPLKQRKSKVSIDGFADGAALLDSPIACESRELEEFSRNIVECAREKKPVILFTGAHPVKNGLAPLFADLMERGIVTLYATNPASAIHSFELALTGSSSENVVQALPAGEFGMAFETGVYLNRALTEGDRRGYGFGESMARLIGDTDFRKAVLDSVFEEYEDTGEYYKPCSGFEYADTNIFYRARACGIPATVHASIGTDIIDQHANSDPGAKGRTSGRDFLIFAEETARCTRGGAVINIGSAVTGPEVLLKAVSMAANTGRPPHDIYTGDFDLRPKGSDESFSNDSHYLYYLRDQKSIVSRIPAVFGGKGCYFQGDHADTVTSLYQYIIRYMEEEA